MASGNHRPDQAPTPHALANGLQAEQHRCAARGWPDSLSMSDGPGFDPYAELGVGIEADAIVIQLAYRARIREVHPDLAGSAGLDHAKRLNVARDWLLDPHRRAQLPPPGAAPGRTVRPRRDGAATYRPSSLDPFRFDFGPRTAELRALLRTIGALTRDERARVNYSLGEARPLGFDGYGDFLGPRLGLRSRALRDAVSMVWAAGVDEQAPTVARLGRLVPGGSLVANAYAQWILLGGFFREELGDAVFRSEHVIESFAARCRGPWEASIRQARYGPHEQAVRSFLGTADALSVDSAERLARSWQRHMGRDRQAGTADHIGPGVWLPAPPDYPEVLRVSGYLAAVDASRVKPPAGLDGQHHDGLMYGLRLTAHVLALGLTNGSARDYLLPWREATDADPSLWSRLRWRMPTG